MTVEASKQAKNDELTVCAKLVACPAIDKHLMCPKIRVYQGKELRECRVFRSDLSDEPRRADNSYCATPLIIIWIIYEL